MAGEEAWCRRRRGGRGGRGGRRARGLGEERVDTARVRAAPQTTFVVPMDGPPLPSRSTSLLAVDAWLRARHHEGTPIALDDAQAAFANGRGKVHKLVALGRALLEQRDREQHTRASGAGVSGAGTHALTDAQMHAVTSIERAIADATATAFLLQGVTGSGKAAAPLYQPTKHMHEKEEGEMEA